ncbi:MAG: hypothetical protein ABIR46_04140, partial [Candidatus Saccharimonadales bacterium]
ILNIGLSIIWLISGKPRHAGALYKSIWWNFTHLKDTLKKRKKIQLLRNVSDTDIFEAVKRNPDFSYYKGLLKGNFDDFEDQAI